MLDIKRIRENPDQIRAALAARRSDIDLDPFFALEQKRRALIAEVDAMRSKSNTVSKQIPVMKKNGEDVTALLAEMKELSATIKERDEELRAVDQAVTDFVLTIPNVPHASVPDGADDADNETIRVWGEPTKFDFEPKAH